MDQEEREFDQVMEAIGKPVLTSAEAIRQSTIIDASYEAAEDIARYALTSLRSKVVQAGLGHYGSFAFKSMEERDQFLRSAKARLSMVLEYGLEEII